MNTMTASGSGIHFIRQAPAVYLIQAILITELRLGRCETEQQHVSLLCCTHCFWAALS